MVQLSDFQRFEVARNCGEVLFPTRFRQLEKQVLVEQSSTSDDQREPPSQYFCGSQLTIADLSLYVLGSAILDGAWEGNGVQPEVLDDCPKLQNIIRMVGEHPAVKEWNAAHPCSWFG